MGAMPPGLNLDGMSDKDKHGVLAQLNEMQVQESMNTYNGLVERCFNECVTGFRSKSLEASEKECVEHCVGKFMQFSQRVAQRFQEKNMQLQNAQGAPPQ